MRNLKSSALVLISFAVILTGCVQRGGESEDPFIGKPAPAFQLRKLGGGEVSLAGLKGRIVILDFWATWCGPCRLSMPLLEKLQKENSSDVTLLAINLMEEPETVREFVQQRGIESTVLLDSDGSVGHEYGSSSIPMQVLVDKKGIVSYVLVGYSPRMGDIMRDEIQKLR